MATRAATDDPHFKDLVLFHEYFHGEDGRGVGASHQTGWTALVARCLESLAKESLGTGACSMSAGNLPVDQVTEWLEADGLGGFASGTTSGIRTRRYHALLLVAAAPPADRRVLVQGFVARLETRDGTVEFWPQAYDGGWITGADVERVEYAGEPWPTWRFFTRLGVCVRVEVFVPRGAPAAVIAFGLDRPLPGARLDVRPSFSGRDFHSLHHENEGCSMLPTNAGDALRFEPYPGVPAVLSLANATYRHAPDWYRGFFYADEAARGLDAKEDLASPGVLSFDIGRSEAIWVLSADLPGRLELEHESPALLVDRLREVELERRRAFAGPLERAASAYLVKRGEGRTFDRRIPLVWRLGPRHVHRPARAVPRHGRSRSGSRDPDRMGRRRLARECCPTASPTTRTRR